MPNDLSPSVRPEVFNGRTERRPGPTKRNGREPNTTMPTNSVDACVFCCCPFTSAHTNTNTHTSTTTGESLVLVERTPPLALSDVWPRCERKWPDRAMTDGANIQTFRRHAKVVCGRRWPLAVAVLGCWCERSRRSVGRRRTDWSPQFCGQISWATHTKV